MKKGFTLIELMLVIAIIIIISTGVVISAGVINDQIRFNSAYQGVESILAQARASALSGESFVDVGRYDDDDSDTDLILPNGYIINFTTVDNVVTASLYADLFIGTNVVATAVIGELDEDDQFIKSIELHESIRVGISAQNKIGSTVDIITPEDYSIIYTTPNADFALVGEPNTSVQLTIDQIDVDNDVKRTKYLFLHYLYGIPELLDEEYLSLPTT